MSLNSQKILGIRVTTSSKQSILEYIKKYLALGVENRAPGREKLGKSFVIVTPNPEQIVLAQTNLAFRDIFNRADVALPDGVGVSLAAKFLGIKYHGAGVMKDIERIPGVEFMEDLVQLAADRGYTIGLIGGKQGLAVRALECLQARYPRLEGWAFEPGQVSLGNLGDLSDLGEKIRKTNTRFVFVGLGAPKQEYFIERLVREMSLRSGLPEKQSRRDRHVPQSGTRDDHKAVIFMSVGGAFDMISGSIQRAPVFIRSVGMEWLWRLFQEPWRWRRQLALLKFVFLVFREKIRTR